MLFNSVEFFVFFAIVYTLYWMLTFRGQNALLLVAGYIFYGWWDVRFLYLLMLSTGLDYCAGLLLGPGVITRRDRMLVSGLLIAAAFLLITVQWDAIRVAEVSPESSAGVPNWEVQVDWSRLLPAARWAWAVPIGTAAAAGLGNLIYLGLLRCDQAFRRRVGLVLTLAVNLTILGFFKYFNFFVDSAGALARSLGLSPPRLYLHLILPVGISFYTFQSLSYTIDVYRRRLEPVRRLADFALFVAFFPPLVAGPIERAAHMLPQLLRPRLITYEQMTRGAFLILHGMFKKVAVADGLAGSVSSIYNTSGATSWADIVAATVLFAFQIYCDFSGYSDIARGVAKFLGFELLVNFRLPYVSRSPSEFWQRWHISLSTWLRDYLYIPLGGNRHGEWKTYRNLMVTMLLGGLWHGAAWNFVLWGLYQGAILCLYRLAAGGRPGDDEAGARQPLRAAAQVAVFFALTCYGWLLFRANSLGQVVGFTRVLLAGPFDAELHMMRPTLAAMLGLPFLIGYEAIEYAAGSPRFYQAPPRPVRGALYGLLVFLTLLGTSNEPTQFIYFQF